MDAFLTFVYIINCLPTHVLTYSSPYEIFFNKAHNYSLLCVLGCICFLLLQPYTAHKLNYRPNACIFLGYSHAEYRCLDPLKDRVYLSWHVVFHENTFPAKDHALLNLPSKINVISGSPFMIPISYTIPDPYKFLTLV